MKCLNFKTFAFVLNGLGQQGKGGREKIKKDLFPTLFKPQNIYLKRVGEKTLSLSLLIGKVLFLMFFILFRIFPKLFHLFLLDFY